MRIAQVAPLYESVPPRLYGGTERVVSWLTEELVSLGHDVTLFASADSVTNARLIPASKRALRLDPKRGNVLNNLALSYALDGKVAEAEQLLHKAQRSAGRAPQVQENLALVLGLRGRYEEARSAGQAALPPAKAEQNVAYLRELGQARSAAGAAASSAGPAAGDPARKANASLPQPNYQLGGPRPAE